MIGNRYDQKQTTRNNIVWPQTLSFPLLLTKGHKSRTPIISLLAMMRISLISVNKNSYLAVMHLLCN